ncbi:MAG: hypothetical protein OEY52_01735 [Gammaproteobacteria bacterium]|nr:hypothetical protein [Gammaproteobacteria bacterium]
MALNFMQLAVNFKVRLNEEAMQRHMTASPYVVGEELARQITEYTNQNELGYYPAIDFFIENGGIEKDLLDAVGNISWLITNLVREEVRIRLRSVFSTIKFESLQTQAFTMPGIRPGQNNAHHMLVDHYTPDQVKVNIIATMVRKQQSTIEATQMARHQICRWLKTRFESLEITNVQTI